MMKRAEEFSSANESRNVYTAEMDIINEVKCLKYASDLVIIFKNSDLTSQGTHYISMTNKQTPWFQYASELYRPSDRRLSVKLVPTSADRGCRVVSATNPHGR
jgi:hypothetical protein